MKSWWDNRSPQHRAIVAGIALALAVLTVVVGLGELREWAAGAGVVLLGLLGLRAKSPSAPLGGSSSVQSARDALQGAESAVLDEAWRDEMDTVPTVVDTLTPAEKIALGKNLLGK